MSEENKTPLTDDQRRAIVSHMFKKTHEDMGLTIALLTKQPTLEGYVVSTETVGEITVRLTRAMGALEKLIQMNAPKTEEVKPDAGLVGGTWSVTPAPADDGKPVMTPAARAEMSRTGHAIMDSIEQMSVGLVKVAPTPAEKPAPGTEAS